MDPVTEKTDTIELTDLVPATPRRLYAAWLDSEEHSAFTRGKTTIEPRVGGAFRTEFPDVWDGHIEGIILELEPDRRIVQRWSSTAFPAGSKDSRLSVTFEADGEQTRVTLVHSGLPNGMGGYFAENWRAVYLDRMKEHFAGG